MTDPKDLCTSLTKDRSPCSKRRIRGSRYCWHHYPRGPVGVAAIVMFVLGGLLSWALAVRGERLTLETAHLAKAFEIPRGRSGDRVAIGNILFVGNVGVIARFREVPLEVAFSPEQVLLLSGEVHDKKGNVVALLKDSRLFVSPGLGYDINSDSSAIEIVDPELRPILQFARGGGVGTMPPVPVDLAGWLGAYVGPQLVFLCRESCGVVTEEEALPVLEAQPRIFRYPGYLHPGARER